MLTAQVDIVQMLAVMIHSTGNEILTALLIFISAVLVLTGCSIQESINQDATLKRIISKYNTLLIEANKTRDVNPLKDVADETVIKKLYWWMTAWEDGNVYLDAEFKNIDFDDLKIQGKTAVVMTSEYWSYIYRDLDTQEIQEPRQFISYKMQYKLEKREDSWLITEINIFEESSTTPQQKVVR